MDQVCRTIQGVTEVESIIGHQSFHTRKVVVVLYAVDVTLANVSCLQITSFLRMASDSVLVPHEARVTIRLRIASFMMITEEMC
jgi:hypothetical protein